MLASAVILPSYILFLTAESFLFIYLAATYQKWMHNDSWDSNVPAEKYILMALWLRALFYTIVTLASAHLILAMNVLHSIHLVITILNASQRSLTMGVTVLLCSGRSLSSFLAICIVGYAAAYVGITKYVNYQWRNDPYGEVVIAYVWPTSMDLLIYGYSLYKLQQTILMLEFTNQTRKIDRYLWLRLLRFVTFILFVRQALLFTGSNGLLEAEIDQAAFFLTIVGMGFLWKPSPANRDFENVVELQSADLEIQSPLLFASLAQDVEDCRNIK